MKPLRKKKLESSIIREMSDLISRRRRKDDEIGFVSVTRVDLVEDFSAATIYISPFAGEEQNERTCQALRRNLIYFQNTLSQNLRFRQTPRLRFEVDTSIREGDRILDRLDEVDPGLDGQEEG